MASGSAAAAGAGGGSGGGAHGGGAMELGVYASHLAAHGGEECRRVGIVGDGVGGAGEDEGGS